MKLRSLFTLTLLMTFGYLADAIGAVYYVAPGGNDSSAGTLSAPWKTIAKANSKLVAGDTVYIRTGTYNEPIRPANSGTATKYITYARYQSETVKITRTSFLDNRKYVVVDGFTFDDTQSYLIQAVSASYCIIKNCALGDHIAGGSGVLIMNGAYNRFLGNTFLDSTSKVDDCLDSLKLNNTHHNLVEGNIFNRVQHYAIGTTSTSHNVFRKNIFQNTWHAGLGLGTNATARQLVENNVFRNQGSAYTNNPETRARTIMPRGTQFALQMHRNAYNIIVRNNTFYNNGGLNYTPAVNEPTKYNRIYNNTLDQNYRSLFLEGNSDTIVKDNFIKNNIITRGKEYGIYASPNRSNYQSYVNLYTNNAFYANVSNKYKGVVSTDKYLLENSGSGINNSWDSEFVGNLNVDPQFTNSNDRDYTLQNGSQLIDKGAWLTTITSASGSGKTFTVADSGYFCDGWGIVEGDKIQLQGTSTPVTILSIDYSRNTITVNQTISWQSGNGISLPFSGKAPDIGAFEYAGEISRLAAPTNLSIAY
jgi:hypothetical protein